MDKILLVSLKFCALAFVYRIDYSLALHKIKQSNGT
jgi:hypothetical protein